MFMIWFYVKMALWHLCLYMQVYLDFINTCFFGNLPPLPPSRHIFREVWGGSAFNPLLLLFCAVFQSRCNPGKIVCDQWNFLALIVAAIAASLNSNCLFLAAAAVAMNCKCYLLLLLLLL